METLTVVFDCGLDPDRSGWGLLVTPCPFVHAQDCGGTNLAFVFVFTDYRWRIWRIVCRLVCGWSFINFRNTGLSLATTITWLLQLFPYFKSPPCTIFRDSYSAFETWWHTRRNQIPSPPPSPKRTSPFKSAGASVQSTTDSRGVRISGSNAGYTMFRGSEKSTGYPLHSPVSPSLPLPCVTVCHHHISTGLYLLISIMNFKPYYIKFSFIRLLLLYIPTYRFLQKQKSKMLTNLMVWNSGLIQKSYCVWIRSNTSVGLAITPSVTPDKRSIKRELFVSLHDILLQKCHTMKTVT